VTDTNRYGPGVSLTDVRRWAIAGIGLWFPYYLRDSERHHELTPGYCALPAGFRVSPQQNAAEGVPERVKHPEQRLPLILVITPGTTDSPPIREPDRTPLVGRCGGYFHGRVPQLGDLARPADSASR
jgi:hypothetical protein